MINGVYIVNATENKEDWQTVTDHRRIKADLDPEFSVCQHRYKETVIRRRLDIAIKHRINGVATVLNYFIKCPTFLKIQNYKFFSNRNIY